METLKSILRLLSKEMTNDLPQILQKQKAIC